MTRALIKGGRLDRYVMRLFGLSYLAAFLLVVGLYVIIDSSVNLDEYLTEHADGTMPGMGTIGRYYALHLPFLYLEMSPFVTLVAGLFTAAKMVRHNEVVAALNAGVSSRRLFAPVYLGAVLLAGGMFALREWATEALSRERDVLREYLIEQREEPVLENFWVKDSDRQRVRLEEYRANGPLTGGPEMTGITSMIAVGDAAVAIDAALAHSPELVDGRWRWQLVDGHLTYVDESKRRGERIEVFDHVNVGPDDVEVAWRGRTHPLDLSFAQVRVLLERDPDNLQYRTVRQYHLTFPLAGLLLLLVGMPFLVGQRRGRGVERVGVGVLLCLVYFGTDFVTRTLGLQGLLGPVYAAWFPVVLFGSLGLVLTGSMRS